MTVFRCAQIAIRMRVLFALGVIAANFNVTCVHAAEPAAAGKPDEKKSNDTKKEEWIQLFNGKNLEGWQPRSPATTSKTTTPTRFASKMASSRSSTTNTKRS